MDVIDKDCKVFESGSDKFIELFNNEKLSDVQFLMDDDRSIYGHSLVLSLTSTVFETLFASTHNEKKLIPLLGMHYDNVQSFIQFLYTEDVHLINYDNCFDLFNLALKYETLILEQNLLAYIYRNTRPRNTLEHFDFFVNLNYRFMSEHLKCAIIELFQFRLDYEQFYTLSFKSVIEIMNISVVSSEVNLQDVIVAVMKWAQNKCMDGDDREIRKYFGEHVKNFKFTSMSVEQVNGFIKLYPRFFEEVEVKALLHIVTKQPGENNFDFTMEPLTKRTKPTAVYNYLQGDQIFNTVFNTREQVEIVGIWIGATQLDRICRVSLLDENGDVKTCVATKIYLSDQDTFPIKFQARLRLEPNRQYQINVSYEQTDCAIAGWPSLEDTDIINNCSVLLVKKCQFIRKIHFENIL